MTTPGDMHRELREKLDLPSYYGNNLDALWDCLTGWLDLPLCIHWYHYEQARAAPGNSADEVLDTLQQAEKELDGFRIVVH